MRQRFNPNRHRRHVRTKTQKSIWREEHIGFVLRERAANAPFEPRDPEKGVSGRWTEHDGRNVGTKGKARIKRTINEQHELNIRVLFDESLGDLVGIPSETLELVREQEPRVDGNAHRCLLAAERDLHRHRLFVAKHRYLCCVAGLERAQRCHQIVDVLDGCSAHLRNDILALQAGLLSS